jgi:hypothetical protein
VVIVAPPLEAGAVYVTVAVVEPVAVAVPMVGAPGAVAAAAATTNVTVAVELPAVLVAVTVKTVEAEVTDGVPVKIPVLVEKLTPAGTLGDTE